MSGYYGLEEMHDVDAVQMCARKCGEDLRSKFKLCQNPKDSSWIDLTDNTPCKVRRNGYEPIRSDGTEEEQLLN